MVFGFEGSCEGSQAWVQHTDPPPPPHLPVGAKMLRSSGRVLGSLRFGNCGVSVTGHILRVGGCEVGRRGGVDVVQFIPDSDWCLG